MSARFDVVVVGAGPGGIAAAAVAAEAGRRVCLLDNGVAPGGQIWRGYRAETAEKAAHGREYLHWMKRLKQSSCTVWTGWQAIDRPTAGVLRLECRGEGRDVEAKALILATGARERFLPFPGWTLPGVMGAGGLQALVKGGLDPAGKRVVVAGSGPLLLAVAASVGGAGARIHGIYEQAPLGRLAGFGLTLLRHPDKLIEGAGYRMRTWRAAYRTGCWIVRAEGRDSLERVTLTDGHRQWSHNCDWLACGFQLVSNLELPRLLGCRIEGGLVVVDKLQQSSVQGVACVGELTGIGGMEKALLEGQIAGWAAAGCAAQARALRPRLQRWQRFALRLSRAFALRAELRGLADADTVVCRCEDVTHAALAGRAGWREAKLYTRCGMGACQGRVCGSATEFLYGWQNPGVRPPVYPTPVFVLADDADAASAHR
jgi:NADPH-dependent 2,4-dienoyl-CoA reductase/sulfur reductase-like enzyme